MLSASGSSSCSSTLLLATESTESRLGLGNKIDTIYNGVHWETTKLSGAWTNWNHCQSILNALGAPFGRAQH